MRCQSTKFKSHWLWILVEAVSGTSSLPVPQLVMVCMRGLTGCQKRSRKRSLPIKPTVSFFISYIAICLRGAAFLRFSVQRVFILL